MSDYQRLFYILKNMDSEVGYPTGYIKVEINCEVAKLQIALSNLLNRQGLIYQLYGIKKADNQLVYTVICDVPNVNGRAEVKINAGIHSIGSNSLSLEDINIFAIITQLPNRTPSIKCPLVAYTKGELAWKEEFEQLLFYKEQPASSYDIAEKVTMDNFKQGDEIEVSEDIEQTFDVSQDIPPQDATELPNYKKIDISGEFEAALTSIYNIEKPTAFEQEKVLEPTLVEDDILSSAQKNFKDISSIDIDGDKTKNELNMPSLKEELDKSFEIYNPFKMKSKSFIWWKINSPGFLNNILFRNDVKTYLLFNPKVMLAHYKYRYIIFGIRNDRHSGKEYFICGVPGVYSIDENPFGSMGSWAQLEGYKPRYGAFGYWIILIDPKTGKLIKIK